MSAVSIITVNYNQHQVNIDFFKSLLKYPSKNLLEVIFVDNGSKQQYEAEYKSLYPGLIYLQTNQNLGFAGGNNVGIKAAKGEYLLLLNNDTEITEGFIDQLVAEMEANSSIGLLSPLILYFDQPEVIQYAGFTKMNYLTCRNQGIGNNQVNSHQYQNDSRETAFCHGAAMMCRRSDLQTVGLLPEQYFLYYEELDWCEQFKKAGKKCWFTGKAQIFHKESISTGKQSKLKTYFMSRNRFLFIRRNTSTINTFLFGLYYLTLVATKETLSYLLNKNAHLIPYLYKGIFWNFTHRTNSKNLGFKL